MKRISFVIYFLMVSTLCLTACDPASYRFDYEYIVDNVVKIELVECENDNPKNIHVDSNTILKFNYNEIKKIKQLDASKFNGFIDELSKVTFHLENRSVNAPVGFAVLIHLKNNETIVLSCTNIGGTGYSMVAKFSSNCDFIKHIAYFADKHSYDEIVKKYFNYDISEYNVN